MEKKFRESDEIRYYGAPVSEGIAIGKPHFLNSLDEDLPDFEISIGDVDAEIARYRKALFSSKEDLTKLRHDLAMEGSDEAVHFIESHIQMLDDPMITTHMEGKIRQMLRNTESVFHSVIHDYENKFSQRTDSFFQERLVDVMDISKRIMSHLRNKREALLSEIPSESIVLTEEIAPSYTAAAHAAQIAAFITQNGGGNSHAALIARSKGIPYVANVDVGKMQRSNIQMMIVDGTNGLIIANPTSETLEEYRTRQKTLATRYQLYLEEDHLLPETLDGVKMRLFVNVGNPHDLDPFPYQHDGVGLFRSEYLFFQSTEFYPSESYQEEAYKSLIDQMEEKPVVIRVFDLGGDKTPNLLFQRKKEPNPVLGLRGIRFLLRNQEIFKMQLRAIFKASTKGNVLLLLPLISDINELHQAKVIIEEVKAQLRQELPFIPDLPIGCMIEVPSAVMICDAIAENCDFLSLGTNDLVQYTLGVDRENPAMRDLYYPAHPSVIRMIRMITTEAHLKKKPLTVCGEIASNALYVPLLIGLGVTELSIAPRYLPLIKQTIRKWTFAEAKELAARILKMSDPKEISEVLTEAQKK